MEKAQMMEDCAANTSLFRTQQIFRSSIATLHARCMLGGNLAGEDRRESWVKIKSHHRAPQAKVCFENRMYQPNLYILF